MQANTKPVSVTRITHSPSWPVPAVRTILPVLWRASVSYPGSEPRGFWSPHLWPSSALPPPAHAWTWRTDTRRKHKRRGSVESPYINHSYTSFKQAPELLLGSSGVQRVFQLRLQSLKLLAQVPLEFFSFRSTHLLRLQILLKLS